LRGISLRYFSKTPEHDNDLKLRLVFHLWRQSELSKTGRNKLAARFASLAKEPNLPQIGDRVRNVAIGVVMTRHLDQLELARRWCISPRTLERWRWTGDGPRYIKLKGRVAYREADVEAFEAERLMESTQRPVQTNLVQS